MEQQIESKNQTHNIIKSLIKKYETYIADVKYFDTTIDPDPSWYYNREGMEAIAKHIHEFLLVGGNKFLYVEGGNGVGKTATVNVLINMFKNIMKETEQYPDDFDYIFVNCKMKSTTYAITKELININKRISAIDAISILMDYLKKKKLPMIIFLDDLQDLKDDNLLYYLSRLPKNLLVIATSKYEMVKITKYFSSHTNSSLNTRKIYLSEYGSIALYKILLARAEKGLKKYDEDMLRVISDYCSERLNGDARITIKLVEALTFEEEYFDYLTLFSDLKHLFEKKYVYDSEAEIYKNTLIDEEERELDEKLKIFREHLSMLLVKILSEDQIRFMTTLNNSEIYALTMISNRSKHNTPIYASHIYNSKKAKMNNLLMNPYMVEKLLYKLQVLDLITLSKVRVGESYQIQIKSKFTEAAINHLNSLEKKYDFESASKHDVNYENFATVFSE